jgi:hypothetical protein
MNARWLPVVMACATWSGAPGGTGATPCPTKRAVPDSCSAAGAGKPAPVSRSTRTSPTLLARIVPSTVVPITPPTWQAVCCRPPATPASCAGAFPTIASVPATTIMPNARPTSTNHGHMLLYDASTPIRERPNIAAAVNSMPSTNGGRGPNRCVSAPASVEAWHRPDLKHRGRRQ